MMPLTISDARKELPQLVKRTAYGGEEIELGSHGKAEATLIGTQRLEELKREVQYLRRRLGASGPGQESARPFAALEAALEEGRLGGGPGRARRARRLIPDYQPETELSWKEMARFGTAGNQEPRYRRRTRGEE
jgi:antitoxin (DNA-binding transcriptional repressor) of toxin-antitoxin stability system